MAKRTANSCMKWSLKDDEFLVNNQNEASQTEMAKMLGRSRKAVDLRLYHLTRGKLKNRVSVKTAVMKDMPYRLMGMSGMRTQMFSSLDEMNRFLMNNPQNSQLPVKVLSKNTITIVEEK